MVNAYYINGGQRSHISSNKIKSRKEYLEKYQGYLFCEKCTARVVFAELSSGKKIFKTAKGSEHGFDCPYKITHRTTTGPTFTADTFSKAISEKHIKSVLKGLNERNMTTPPTKRKVYSNDSPRVIKISDGTGKTNIKPTLDPSAEKIKSGEREPAIRKRNCNDILPEDYNELRGIDGIVNKAIVYSDFIQLSFNTNDTDPVNLLFYNAFKDKDARAYELVKNLAHDMVENHTELLVCCLGVIEKKSDSIQIQIMAPGHITFNNKSINFFFSPKAS